MSKEITLKAVNISKEFSETLASYYKNINKAYPEYRLQQWKDSTLAAIRNKQQFGKRVCIIKFEDLIGDPGSVMHYLAEFLGIEFDPVLLTPTFNKSPIRANTSFKEETTGIVKSTLARHQTLSADQRSMIVDMTREVYSSALDEAVVF